jgi:hypothetical protein
MKRLLFASALAVFACSPAVAEECGGSTIAVTPCKRCTITGSLTTRRDISCIRGYRANNSNYVVLGYQVARQPSHRRVPTSGSSFTYAPAKGFVGSDHFLLELDFLTSDKDVMVTLLDLTMQVGP